MLVGGQKQKAYRCPPGRLSGSHHLIPRWPGSLSASTEPPILTRSPGMHTGSPEQEPAVVPMLLGYPVAVTGPACYFSDAAPSRAFTDVPD